MDHKEGDRLDCLVIGGGPAGLTAALYLARFNRSFLLVDSGSSRAAWIPQSHNFPLFSQGLAGPEILAKQREHLSRYEVAPLAGTVVDLRREPLGFEATFCQADGGTGQVRARNVLLATGAIDVEPDLPNLPDALKRGLVRFCPICDGYEARGQRVAVIGHGDHGLREAIFVARTYSHDVTLLSLGSAVQLSQDGRTRAHQTGIRVIEATVDALEVAGNRIAALRAGGAEYRFDTLYSALGLTVRSGLAVALGAEHDANGALIVDAHNQTSVAGLYAAGDNVAGLNQIVVGMGQAAIAATSIHNGCA
jgi:thioredoxin reductase (NADPH)